LRSRGESIYPPPDQHDPGQPVRVQLPERDPFITAPVARALLRLILNTAAGQQTDPSNDEHGRAP